MTRERQESNFLGLKLVKCPIDHVVAASEDIPVDFMEHAQKIALRSVAEGKTVAIKSGDQIIAIVGPQLPAGGVRPGDPRFDAIVEAAEREKKG